MLINDLDGYVLCAVGPRTAGLGLRAAARVGLGATARAEDIDLLKNISEIENLFLKVLWCYVL